MNIKLSALLLGCLTLLSGCGGSGATHHSTSSGADSVNEQTVIPKSSETETNNRSASTGSASIMPSTDSMLTNNTDWFALDPQLMLLSHNKLKVKPISEDLLPEVAKVIDNTNKLRAEKGLAPLRYDEKLSAYAQRRAEQIVGRFSHTLPDSNLPVVSEINAGENLAAGGVNAQEAVQQWRDSPSHYENIIYPQYDSIGVGIIYMPGSQYGYYWVQLFGIDGRTVSDYYFDTSSAAGQNPLADASTKTQQVQPALRWLSVDGVKISLHQVSGESIWHQISTGNYSGIVSGYSDTRFGVLKNATGNYTAFYQGNNTEYEQMPQSGSAIYRGSAVVSDGQNINTQVEAHLKADFSAKQLNGALVENNIELMGIHANIRGSSFYSPDGMAVSTQGGFFGNNADEVSGVFYENSTSRRGAFAAKKQ